MRVIIAALAALGSGVILTACVVPVTTGDGSGVYRLVIGPMSFLVLGVAGFLRQPEHCEAFWQKTPPPLEGLLLAAPARHSGRSTDDTDTITNALRRRP